MINQHIDHRRHQDHALDLVLLHSNHRLDGIKAWLEVVAAANHGGSHTDARIGDMKHRRNMQNLITGQTVQKRNALHGVYDEVVMRQHYAFGAAGRPTCVEQPRNVIPAATCVGHWLTTDELSI